MELHIRVRRKRCIIGDGSHEMCLTLASSSSALYTFSRYHEQTYEWACWPGAKLDMTVILVANKRDTGAALHTDDSCGTNTLFLQPSATGELGAYWVFVHPSYLQEFLDYSKDNLGLIEGPYTGQDIVKLKGELKKNDSKLDPLKVKVVEQHHGDVIELLPGMVHAVVNVQPNIKILIEGHRRGLRHLPYGLRRSKLTLADSWIMPWVHDRMIRSLLSYPAPAPITSNPMVGLQPALDSR